MSRPMQIDNDDIQVNTQTSQAWSITNSPTHQVNNTTTNILHAMKDKVGIESTSDLEAAHLCPRARMKMDQLFRQWLNIEGTKDMIIQLVQEVKTNPTNIQTTNIEHTINNGDSPVNSPLRSPIRPPSTNINLNPSVQFTTGSPTNNNTNGVSNGHSFNSAGDNSLNGSANNSMPSEMDTVPKKTNDDVAMEQVDMEQSEKNDMIVDEHPNSPSPINSSTGSVTSKDVLASRIPNLFSRERGSRGRFRGCYATDEIIRRKNDIDVRFQEFPGGMAVEDFVTITKDFCGLPSFFNAPFFQRILMMQTRTESQEDLLHTMRDSEISTHQPAQTITKDMFLSYWMEEFVPYDQVERFFRVVKQPDRPHIERDDFAPFLLELLKYHPGLEFLGGTPEFQEKYAHTVVVRIFYMVDRDSSGRITLRKLRHSNLLEAFNCVDEEEDINKVNSYFSYEHFYVLYCKFWELDTDHDSILSQDDLVRYGGHALTRAIVDRIFERGRRPFGRIQSLSAEEKRSMNYEDFIYFMLSEEDKSNPVSIRYWFDLIDTNEDNVIRADEMRLFYRHQIHRMECLGHEIVPFEDILCQMSDLLHPKKDGEFQYADFLKPDKIRLSGVFFNVLFNLSKFIEFEQRDPFLFRQQLAEPELTEWDRYARAEYARLAMEEEGRDDGDASAMEIDTMDGWYVSDDVEDQVENTDNLNKQSIHENDDEDTQLADTDILVDDVDEITHVDEENHNISREGMTST